MYRCSAVINVMASHHHITSTWPWWHEAWHWPHDNTIRIIWNNKTHSDTRIRERDLHVCPPRLPRHDCWVLPGRGFPDGDIPAPANQRARQTDQSEVSSRAKWPMRGQGVLSDARTFLPNLLYCTILLHLIILISSSGQQWDVTIMGYTIWDLRDQNMTWESCYSNDT